MKSEPKNPRQHGAQNESGSPERAMESPVGVLCFQNREHELLPGTTPCQESRPSGPCPGAVESGPDGAQQLCFPRQCRGFVRAFLQLDAGNRAQEAQMAARHPVRVGDSITAQPFAKVPGLADIKNRVTCVAHEIDAGALRQLTEEIAAEPFHQRLRIRKQKLLGRGHNVDFTLRQVHSAS
jgi:hypothetical protein